VKQAIKIFLIFISVFSFSCRKEKSELSILEPKIKANDTIWCVPIGDTFAPYSLLKFIRKDNTIYSLAFFNPRLKVSTSEHYYFLKDESFDSYLVMNKLSKSLYSIEYNQDKGIKFITGNMNVFLDSIAYSEKYGYTLFYTYPRIPYYKIKPLLYVFYDSLTNDIDTIIPKLKSNCHLIINIGNRLPLLSNPIFEYEHFFKTKNSRLPKFKLGMPQITDTIKKVPYPKQLDLFYTKEIDYSKYPFEKEEE
jgi:hypothetical protein